MGNGVKAHTLVKALIRYHGLSESVIGEFFTDVPLDFPIFFRRSLPFQANRFGMIGITLRGKVWLLKKAEAGTPIWLLSLIRHEAEHVRQQRLEPLLFYPRYVLYWLAYLLNPFPGTVLRNFRQQFGWLHGAYRKRSNPI